MVLQILEKGKPARKWCAFHGHVSGVKCSQCDGMWAGARKLADEIAAEVQALRSQREPRTARRKMA